MQQQNAGTARRFIAGFQHVHGEPVDAAYQPRADPRRKAIGLERRGDLHS